MRKMLVFAMMLTLVGSAMAFDLGTEPTAKPDVNYPVNVPNGDRQGGEDILNAVAVTLPVINGSGTTEGYLDDYDEVCPYTGSTAPDVVYSAIGDGGAWDIDLFGSTYDTKLYVYNESLELVACNDDFYADYVSKLGNIALMAGVQYFIVIDGYGGDFGDYVINITPFTPCVVCPPGAELEMEPALVSGYIDAHNGGCNSVDQGAPFGVISSDVFCGVTGFYDTSRDTDWFEVVVPSSGVFEVIGTCEIDAFIFELAPTNCDAVAVIQDVTMSCEEATMTIPGAPGSTIWVWVGPTVFGTGAVEEYNYTLYTNLIVATENHSFSEVKALFE